MRRGWEEWGGGSASLHNSKTWICIKMSLVFALERWKYILVFLDSAFGGHDVTQHCMRTTWRGVTTPWCECYSCFQSWDWNDPTAALSCCSFVSYEHLDSYVSWCHCCFFYHSQTQHACSSNDSEIVSAHADLLYLALLIQASMHAHWNELVWYLSAFGWGY